MAAKKANDKGAKKKAPPKKDTRFKKGHKQGGRPKGSQNRVTKEVREMTRALVDDPEYQETLRNRLLTGDLPAGMETMIWYYAFGKPKDRVELTGADDGPVRISSEDLRGALDERICKLRGDDDES